MTSHLGATTGVFVRERSWRRHLPAMAGWTLLCLLFFATLLLGLEHLPTGDFTGQFHAYALFQARELAAGRFPVWSPGSNGGFPFAADVQSAAFYPPRLLMVLLSLPWGFSLYVLQLEALLHVWLAGLFTYWFAYCLTGSRRAGLLGAIAFALGGYLTSYPLQQLAILETITWLPLALAFLWQASRSRKPVHWLLAAGLILGLSALAGHPQTFLHVAYVAALYFLFLAMRARWTVRWTLIGGASVFAIATGASAAMWLPAVQFAAYSTRASVSYEFVSAGQALLNYLQLFVPHLFTLWSPEYVGLATVLLALYAWHGRGELARQNGGNGTVEPQLSGGRSEIVFWAALGLVAAWMALGEEGVLFRLLYRIAPGFSLFRQQERLLGVVSLSWALLAAQGFALWLRVGEERRRALLRAPAMAALSGLGLAGFFVFGSPLADLVADGATWLGQLAIAALALILLWRGRGRPLASFSLLLLVAADLYLVMDASDIRQPGTAIDYWQRPAWLAQLESDQRPGLPGRIDTRNQFQANVGEVYGLEDVRGISPMRLAAADAVLALPEWRRWQLLDVEHVVSPEPISEPAERLASVDQPLQSGRTVDAELFRLPRSQGRAWLSYNPVQVAGPAEALDYLALPEFDVARDVVLHTPVAGLDSVQAPPGGVEAVQQPQAMERVQPNALAFDVASETPALLVISEWRYPGWRAWIDGVPVTLFPADYTFQALLIPAGNHTVQLRFIPLVVLAGALISAFSVAGALVVARAWRPFAPLREESWQDALALPQLAAPEQLNEVLTRLSSLVRENIALLLYGTVFLAAASRLWHLSVQELRGDEGFSFLLANRPLGDVIPALLAAGDPHPPLHYLLLSGWLRLAGDSEFSMRILPALVAVLLVPLMYQFGRRVWSKTGGLLLALLFTVSQSQVWLAQDTRSQYVLALFFTMLATSLLVCAVQESRLTTWALYGLAAALAMYSHYFGVFALLAHGAYVLSGYRRRFSAWVASGIAAFLLFLPWLLASVGGWSAQLSEPGPPNLAAFLIVVARELLVGPAMSKAAGPWPLLGAALLCAMGWQRLRRRQAPMAWFLGIWLAAAVLGIFLIQMQRATFNPFYVSVAAPAWWALFFAGVCAVGWPREGATAWHQTAAILIVLVVLAVNAAGLRRYWSDPYAYGRSRGYRQMAQYLEANVGKGDLLLANYPDPALTYYTRDISVAYAIQPVRLAQAAAEIEQELRVMSDAYRRLWFVPVRRSTWDREDVVLRWLDYNLLLEQRRTFAAVTVEAYRPLHSMGEVLLPLNRVVNEQLRLNGAYLTVDGRPAPLADGPVVVPAGAELNVTLLWQALNEIPRSYTVFVHLLDENGQLIAQHDGVPAYGTRPTETWEVEENILDEHMLTAPPETGNMAASLVVGVYDSTTVERQLFDNGADHVSLVQVRIEPRAPSPTVGSP